MRDIKTVIAENRDACLRFAQRNHRPFTITRYDVELLPALLDSLPLLEENQPDGWNRVAVIPFVALKANWRTFILLDNAYGILPDGKTVARFRPTVGARLFSSGRRN